MLSWWAKFGSLGKICAADEAVRLARASADAVGEIGRFCADHGIDAHFRGDGWLWAATSGPQVGSWKRPCSTRWSGTSSIPSSCGEPETVARPVGVRPAHCRHLRAPPPPACRPALLARGLRRAALSAGVRIYERTPMTRLERGRPPRVVTASGSVTAEKVVIAMNAWATVFPELRRTIVVVSSDIVTTRPIPERLAASGWSDGMCISDSRTLVNYYRPTMDGRVAFGTGGGRLSFGNRVDSGFDGASPRAREVEGYFRRIYPGFGDVPIATHWTGPIDRSLNGLPFFGRLDGRDDLLYGLGFSGNGVGPTFVGGRILASLALGTKDEWSQCGLVRSGVGLFPREPVRYVGGRMVIAANRRKERLEDEGRVPGPLTVALAGLAPAGLVPVKGVDAPAAKA